MAGTKVSRRPHDGQGAQAVDVSMGRGDLTDAVWSADGTWERLLEQVQAAADAADENDWDISVDSTIVRAHRHAAGARTDPPPMPASKGPQRRNTRTEHRRIASDRHRRPASRLHPVHARPGQDPRAVTRTGQAPQEAGQPRCGQGLQHRPVREDLRRRDIRHTIPEKTDGLTARLRKGSRGGRPPAFDEDRYRKRHTVERLINRLKEQRAGATRCDKCGNVYPGTVAVAALTIWMRT
ncbi:hypothetical protein [Streptomyces xanthophaeus]